MNLKSFLLENNNNDNNFVKELLSDNQIVKLSKCSNYIPYSATYYENGIENIFSLNDYYQNKVIKDPFIEHGLDNLDIICQNSEYRLNKMGIDILKLNPINLLIANFNENTILNSDDDGLILIGKAFFERNTIAINKETYFDDFDEFEGVIVHETAHLIWELLPKKNKEWFKDWYRQNIIGELIRDVELTKEDINVIWEAFQTVNVRQPRKAIQTTIPNLILKVLEYKLESKEGLQSFKNAIIDAFKTRFQRNKNILTNEKEFKGVLSKIKFSGRPISTSEIKSSRLRNIAYEKGLTPSDYAAYNFDELWAETIEYMSDDKEIPKPLQNAIKKVISSLS